ncbi:DNA primase family protein [Priestia aryabhattai]|uniref:DNA primase family protein n=1 Tax=Priestia aryabhattai TaxID=412384 RepID=UPI003CEC5031
MSKMYEGTNVIEMPNRYFTRNYQGQLKFNHHLVKDEILKDHPIYRTDIGIVRYENGVYKRSTQGDILHLIQKKIGTEATVSRKREILDLILHEHEAKPLSEFNNGIPLLNLKNGVYSLQTKSIVPHSKFFHWTIQHPVSYDPEAKCPAILEFLHDIFDEDGVQFVIEWLAYCCLPFTDTDKILFFLGKGGNGKSTLQNILKCFLGVDNVTNMSLKDLTEDKFAKAHLYGKLANICGDIDSQVINNTGVLKNLTGGEPIYGQFKGLDGFSFQSFAKLIFSANELPMSTDKTHGYFRRIFILPFEKHLPEEKKISRSTLDKRLTDSKELSGLLNLVLEAIDKLKANDYQFTVPEAAKRALEQYKYTHDKTQQFINEHFNVDKLDNTMKTTLKHFYHAYKDWCRENEVYPEKKLKIQEQLKEKGFIVKEGAGNKMFVYGLIFKDTSDYFIKTV